MSPMRRLDHIEAEVRMFRTCAACRTITPAVVVTERPRTCTPPHQCRKCGKALTARGDRYRGITWEVRGGGLVAVAV